MTNSSEPTTPQPTANASPDTREAVDAMTADQVWEEIENTYLKIYDLINALPPDERERLAERFMRLGNKEVKKWHSAAFRGMGPDQIYKILLEGFTHLGMEMTEEKFHHLKNMMKTIEDTVHDRLTVKPRNVERDDEIVRLHDIENLSFEQIARKLKTINPGWTGKNNKQLSRDAVKAAYIRKKKRGNI